MWEGIQDPRVWQNPKSEPTEARLVPLDVNQSDSVSCKERHTDSHSRRHKLGGFL